MGRLFDKDITFGEFLKDVQENHGAEVESEDGICYIYYEDEEITVFDAEDDDTEVQINTAIQGGPHLVKVDTLYRELGIVNE